MSTQVWIRHDSNGWVLVPEASSQEILVGPVDSESDLRSVAVDLDYEIKEIVRVTGNKPRKGNKVKDMPIGHVFRIEGMWYRMRKQPECLVDVIGQGKTTNLTPSQLVTEISVMSLQ